MFIFLLLMYAVALKLTMAYGYDAGSDQAACGRPLRGSRMMRPPCDLKYQSYCTSAGNTYPWQAVRRFIRENQGLMRRMYGDERHLRVLRDEMQKRENNVWDDEEGDEEEENGGGQGNGVDEGQKYRSGYDEYLFAKERYAKQRHEEVGNDIEDVMPVITSARYLHENNDDISTVLKTKFIYSEQPGKAVKIKDLNIPYFRQTMSTTQRTYVYTEPPMKEKYQEDQSQSNLQINFITNISSTSTANTANSTSTNSSIYANASKSAVDTEFNESNSTFSFTLDDVMEDDTTEIDVGNRTKNMDELGEIGNSTTTNAYEAIVETTTFPEEVRETTQKPMGEILFQDMDNESTKKNQNINYNKLKGVNACPVKEEVVAPFWANNTRGEVLALLNLYPFEQYVHWEKCTHEHRQMYCRDGCRCEQQYRLHRLLAYDPTNECRGIFSDWFRFPSCCVCKCYDMPMEFRVTSRSPRKLNSGQYKRSPDPDKGN